MSDFFLQRRSLIQVFLITLLALILTVSLLLGGILVWQGRAQGSDATPGVVGPGTPTGSPQLVLTPTEGGFRVQGSDWPGFTELTLRLEPRTPSPDLAFIDLGAVVANARGAFNVQYPWTSVENRQPGVGYDLVAASDRLRVATPFNLDSPGTTPVPGVTPSPQPSPAPDDPACTVVADALNVRSGPGTSYPSLTAVTYGASVRPLARTQASDWVQVALANGTAGWVASAYLECNVSLASLPVVQTAEPTPTPTPAPDKVAIALAPLQGWAGTALSVSGVNWTPGSTVFVSLAAPGNTPSSDVYAQAVADASGRFTTAFAFPAEERWLSLPQVSIVAHSGNFQNQAAATFSLVPPAPSITEWKGEYFPGRTPSTAPVLVRNDSKIDFNWGSAAPAPGLPANDFSVRWTRTLPFEAGDYRFYARSDDGVRLWVDDWLVVDEWNDGGAGVRTGDFRGIGAGDHTVKVEYYEAKGDAFVTVWWERVGPVNGWKGEYFNNGGLDDTPALVRGDNAINFDWGSGSPAAGIAADDFSVRWTRRVPFEDGLYRFSARADDGIRVWVDGETLIDQWNGDTSKTYTADLPLAKGNHDVKVEYREINGDANVQFSWQRLGNRPAPKPQITLTASGRDQFVVAGSNWPARSTVTLVLSTVARPGEFSGSLQVPLDPATTDANGRFRATYTLPAELPAEVSFLVANSGKQTASIPFTLHQTIVPGKPTPGGGTSVQPGGVAN
jgi:hypothetical protein